MTWAWEPTSDEDIRQYKMESLEKEVAMLRTAVGFYERVTKISLGEALRAVNKEKGSNTIVGLINS